MITEGILRWVFDTIGAVVGAAFDLAGPIPGVMSEAMSMVPTIFAWIHGFDTWIPVSLTLTCMSAVLLVWATSVLLGLARVVISYFTLGGGAT